jgi:hypothetical protein
MLAKHVLGFTAFAHDDIAVDDFVVQARVYLVEVRGGARLLGHRRSKLTLAHLHALLHLSEVLVQFLEVGGIHVARGR